MLPALTALLLTAAPAVRPIEAVPHGATAWAFATGTLSSPRAGTPEELAGRFIRENAERIGWLRGATAGEMERHGTRWGTTVVVSPALDGIPVLGMDVAITFDNQGRATRVSSASEALQVGARRPTVAASQALSTAARQVPGALLGATGEVQGATRLVFTRVGDLLALAWQVSVPSLLEGTRNDVLLVDASTGELLRHENRVFRARTTAQVYGGVPFDDGGNLSQVDVPDTDGGALPDGGGFLAGPRANASNCCQTRNCEPDAGPRRADGGFSFGLFSIPFDVAVCDRVPRATNERTEQDYVYPPIDPPRFFDGGIVRAGTQDPALDDHFAEVQAYTSALAQYDYFIHLSGTPTGFVFKDNRGSTGKPFLVWANLAFPNIDFAQASSGSVRSDTLQLLDNAAFIPKETWQSQPTLQTLYNVTTSALVFFQGPKADFAYDTSVAFHEFTHGMVYTVATFDGVAFKPHAANIEHGAMNEGLADYFAAAHLQHARIGEYVGRHVDGLGNEGSLRDLAGTDSCPDVLWGEVHQDSKHFAQAIWAARQGFLGTDQGDTFDAAVYAAVVGIQRPTFATMTTAICTQVGTAFPSVTNARTTCEQAFTSRGVIGCSDLLTVPGNVINRPYFGMAGIQDTGSSRGTGIPGPVQFVFNPAGKATRIRLAAAADSGGGLGGPAPAVKVLVGVGRPVTFTGGGASGIQNDATATFNVTAAGGRLTADGDLGCVDGPIHVALFNTGAAGVAAQDLTLTLVGGNCTPTSSTSGSTGAATSGSTSSATGTAGSSGGTAASSTGAATGSNGTAGTAGSTGSSAGSTGATASATGSSGGTEGTSGTTSGAASTGGSGETPSVGCGCAQVDGSAASLLVVALGAFSRRRRH